MTRSPAFPLSSAGMWDRTMAEQIFDFEVVAQQGNDTSLPRLYVMVMTPLPLCLRLTGA